VSEAQTGTVYRTRIVFRGGRDESGLNHFSDPDEAKRYLETYLKERYNIQPAEWRAEQSADEKWSMRPDDLDGRAVVMGCPVHHSADEPLEAMRNVLRKMEEAANV